MSVAMHIWVDADACPNVIKDILFRAAKRTQTKIILVANQMINIPPSPLIKMVRVPSGFDVADNYIIQQVKPGDLIITADIPLADAAIQKGGTALNPRGELYSENNIKQRLSVRDFTENLRNIGMVTGGPATLSKREIQAFANSLDQFLTNSSMNKT
jgi:uncharacterized protein YaiI (UPF0178 family)